uniref:Uncharacterized protein n=1 Tax=Rhizophora mucronata TaxID=61149 RepID=A0A2P2IRD8_RHIMU
MFPPSRNQLVTCDLSWVQSRTDHRQGLSQRVSD